jgi:hypothetical protein
MSPQLMTPTGKYAGADWMQRQLDALHRINPKKHSEIKLSSLGVKVADFLGEWQYGIYHLNQKELFKANWSSSHHIEISIFCSGLSTHDFNDLTRLVFLAHAMALRVSITPSTHHRMRIMFHERTHGESDGKILRHPTLDEAVNAFQISSTSITE